MTPEQQQQYITPDEAVELYKSLGFGDVNRFTIINWAKQYDIGLKVGGRWKVNKMKFEQFLREGTYREET